LYAECIGTKGMAHCWIENQVTVAKSEILTNVTEQLNKTQAAQTARFDNFDRQLAQTATKQQQAVETINATLVKTEASVAEVLSTVNESKAELKQQIDTRASQASVSHLDTQLRTLMTEYAKKVAAQDEIIAELKRNQIGWAELWQLWQELKGLPLYVAYLAGAYFVWSLTSCLRPSSKPVLQQDTTQEPPKRVRRVRAAEPRDEVPTRSTRSKRAVRVSPA
jgi:hypothetical protein